MEQAKMSIPSEYNLQKISEQKRTLPIYSMKERFLKIIKANQVVIVKGETGSGKSTQLTQYLYEAGFAIHGKIGCTQPRRIAAKSLAQRVADEMGSNLGDKVGYKIRFDYTAAADTSIIYMTDGILLNELALEPQIYSYSVIILDEAHERLVNTDMLLGILKSTIKRRPDLKIIITSATLDSAKFSRYFDNAIIFEIPGRTFPVDILYESNPVPDHINACLSTILKIHRTEKSGDVLVFLPGQQEIELLCDKIVEVDGPGELLVLPCYASLTMEEQNKVFEPVTPEYKRKIVVATNIAETSLTIDGIVYVVDSGIMKESQYNPRTRMTTLVQRPITQAQAIQRSGRAGRTRPGKAFRLYSETYFSKMAEAPVPEIQRSNLESNILLLVANGVEDIYKFDFMDPPSPESIRSCLIELQDLQALTSTGGLTSLGRQMSRFPLDPRLSRMLITSSELNCSEEILKIVSMLSVQSSTGKVFFRPRKLQRLADMAKARFFNVKGDYTTLLNVFNSWIANNKSERWCRENFINFKALEESVNISQVARKSSRGFGYLPYSSPNNFAFIHAGSALFRNPPQWVIYEELKNLSGKPNLINVIAIQPDWIQLYAPGFYKKMMTVLPGDISANNTLDLDDLVTMLQL
ncbi:unnamed protein product [Allacma fusca]|uniref:RNA helicase n=1 Tax=Allacma fusca TaxID=39272 RepID=A0A8J2NQP1_9HEXA|nr:unnamed protein product [Allacma fusca]